MLSTKKPYEYNMPPMVVIFISFHFIKGKYIWAIKINITYNSFPKL